MTIPISDKYPIEWWEKNTVMRWGVTWIPSHGMRVLTFSTPAYRTKASREDAEKQLHKYKNSARGAPVRTWEHHHTMEVREVRCWCVSFEPVHTWFDDC